MTGKVVSRFFAVWNLGELVRQGLRLSSAECPHHFGEIGQDEEG